MKARLWLAGFVFCSQALSGCGTIEDCDRGAGPRPFGGVRWDLGDQRGCVRTPFWIGVWDVPFSFVLDTVLLPYTIFCKEKPEPESTP
ncbi:MAG TPA: YceK/YidQ family lipoprotein [Planctomycetota bacterium]|nr:YceK/YidQ family lipoprotein [Planctomycetota bacterium]